MRIKQLNLFFSTLLMVGASLTSGACEGVETGNPPLKVTQEIRNETATELRIEGATLTIPEGAVEDPVEVTAEQLSFSPDSEFVAYTRTYRFYPFVLRLAKPALLVFEVDNIPENAEVFYRPASDKRYRP